MSGEQAALAAVRHPLRREILRYLVEKGEPLSPDRVARGIGRRLNSVTYHLRVLKSVGAVIVVDRPSLQGRAQHHYTHSEAVTGVGWVREVLGLPPADGVDGDDRRR